MTERAVFDRLSDDLRIRTGDILWNSTGTGTIGRAVVYDGSLGLATCDSHITIVRVRDLLPSYACYFIETIRVQHLVTDGNVGSTNQLELPRAFVQGLLIPAPPLAEQKRIVARIDDLFAEIAAGEAALVAAREGLGTFRRALLKAAVTGELTREWRAKNKPKETGHDLLARIRAERAAKAPTRGRRATSPAPLDPSTLPDLPEGWAWARLSDVVEVATGATPARKESAYWVGGDIAWFTSASTNSRYADAAEEFITMRAVSETNCKVFPPGTLLVAMYGEGKTRGQITELRIPGACNQACAALVFDVESTKVRPWIIYWFSSFYLKLRSMASGGVQPNLNLEIIKSLVVPLPPVDEMRVTMKRIEETFSANAALLENFGVRLGTVAALRQSILKAAFEGRLVDQDPNDEPAAVLLARHASRVSPAPAKRRGRRAKNGIS